MPVLQILPSYAGDPPRCRHRGPAGTTVFLVSSNVTPCRILMQLSGRGSQPSG